MENLMIAVEHFKQMRISPTIYIIRWIRKGYCAKI